MPTRQVASSSQRIKHIDVIKGMSIILVVLGHSHWVLEQSAEANTIGLSFRMPLFFFASGIFFQPNMPFGQLFWGKLDALVKPYAVTLLLLAPYQLWLLSESAHKVLVGIAYGNGETIIWSPMWFLPHLFVVFLFSWGLLRLTKLEHASWQRQSLVMTLLLVSGYAFTMQLWPYLVNNLAPNANWYGNDLVRLGLPFDVDIVMLSSFFFLLGFLLKPHVVHFRFRLWPFVAVLLFFVAMHARFDYALHFFGRRYDHVLWTTLIALAGIYTVIGLAWFASQQPVLERIISFVGYNSLFVLIFHWYLQQKAYSVLVYPLGMVFANVMGAILAIIGSLVFAAIIRSNPLTALLWLPQKTRQQLAVRRQGAHSPHHIK
jgi:fucose 4-O-acetylase-like acetyltransferase